MQGKSPYDEQVGFAARRPPRLVPRKAPGRDASRLLPLRSMVGQLPLEQHIGVRIPEGQPIHYK